MQHFLRAITIGAMLSCSFNAQAIKFEATDIIHPVQVLATVLLPLIVAYDTVYAPDFSELEEHGTPEIVQMCQSWKKAKKPYAVKNNCEKLEQVLYSIYNHDKTPSSRTTDPIIDTITKKFGKTGPATRTKLKNAFNAKMNDIEKQLSA